MDKCWIDIVCHCMLDGHKEPVAKSIDCRGYIMLRAIARCREVAYDVESLLAGLVVRHEDTGKEIPAQQVHHRVLAFRVTLP